MKRYIIIRFSQEYDNALEDYDNLYSLHTGTTNDIMVSSNKYANIKESIDTAVAAFIKRLIDEFGYAQYIGVNNIQYGELCTNKDSYMMNRNIEKDSVLSINAELTILLNIRIYRKLIWFSMIKVI